MLHEHFLIHMNIFGFMLKLFAKRNNHVKVFHHTRLVNCGNGNTHTNHNGPSLCSSKNQSMMILPPSSANVLAMSRLIKYEEVIMPQLPVTMVTSLVIEPLEALVKGVLGNFLPFLHTT